MVWMDPPHGRQSYIGYGTAGRKFGDLGPGDLQKGGYWSSDVDWPGFRVCSVGGSRWSPTSISVRRWGASRFRHSVTVTGTPPCPGIRDQYKTAMALEPERDRGGARRPMLPIEALWPPLTARREGTPHNGPRVTAGENHWDFEGAVHVQVRTRIG